MAWRVAFTVPIVKRWPVVPLKVSRARCPWRVVVMLTEAPLIWIVPTLRSCDSVRGALPMFGPGSTIIV